MIWTKIKYLAYSGLKLTTKKTSYFAKFRKYIYHE